MREAACCYCGKWIEILDYSPPDTCNHCGQFVEWDWYEDYGEDYDYGPLYFTVKKAEPCTNALPTDPAK